MEITQLSEGSQPLIKMLPSTADRGQTDRVIVNVTDYSPWLILELTLTFTYDPNFQFPASDDHDPYTLKKSRQRSVGSRDRAEREMRIADSRRLQQLLC